MTVLHTSLNQLHEVVTWNAFPTVLKDFYYVYYEHFLSAFPSLCIPTHAKPSQLDSAWVIVEARSCDATLHHSPAW